MKIVSRDYSIGQNKVEAENTTATNSLLPQNYATKKQVTEFNNLSNSFNAISTIISTVDTINKVATSEDTTQDKDANAANFVQSLNNAGSSTCSSWKIDTDTSSPTYGTRIADESFSGILQSAYDRIDSADYTNDARAELKSYYKGLYDTAYNQFANQATNENLKMQNQQWEDTLTNLIQSSAQKSEAARLGTGTYKDLFSSENAIKAHLLQRYTGDGYSAAYKAAINQRDYDATVSEILGINKNEGEGAAIAKINYLREQNAIDDDKWGDLIGKVSKASTAINTQVKEKAQQDATAAIKNGMMVGIVKKVAMREMDEAGYSDVYKQAYSYAFDEAQKTALDEKYKDFSLKLNGCMSIDDVNALERDISFDKASFSGAGQETYNSMASLMQSKREKIQASIDNALDEYYKKIVTDSNFYLERYNSGVFSTEDYITLCSQQLKMAEGDEKTQQTVMENMRKCLSTLPQGLDEMAKASHEKAEQIAKLEFKSQRSSGDYREYTDFMQGYTLALDDYLRDKTNATQLDVDNFLAKYTESWKNKNIMKISPVFEFTDIAAGFSNDTGNPIEIKNAITRLANMGGMVFFARDNTTGVYKINACNSQTLKEFDKVAQVFGDIISTSTGESYLFGDNRLPLCVGLERDANGWETAIPWLMNESGTKVSYIDQNMNVITQDCKYDFETGDLVLGDTKTVTKANTQYIDNKNKFWSGAVAVASDGDATTFANYLNDGIKSGIITQKEGDNAYNKYFGSNLGKAVNSTPEVVNEYLADLDTLAPIDALSKINDAVNNGIITETEAQPLREQYKAKMSNPYPKQTPTPKEDEGKKESVSQTPTWLKDPDYVTHHTSSTAWVQMENNKYKTHPVKKDNVGNGSSSDVGAGVPEVKSITITTSNTLATTKKGYTTTEKTEDTPKTETFANTRKGTSTPVSVTKSGMAVEKVSVDDVSNIWNTKASNLKGTDYSSNGASYQTETETETSPVGGTETPVRDNTPKDTTTKKPSTSSGNTSTEKKVDEDTRKKTITAIKTAKVSKAEYLRKIEQALKDGKITEADAKELKDRVK